MTDLAEMPENALPRHQGTLTLIAGYDLGNSTTVPPNYQPRVM